MKDRSDDPLYHERMLLPCCSKESSEETDISGCSKTANKFSYKLEIIESLPTVRHGNS